MWLRHNAVIAHSCVFLLIQTAMIELSLLEILAGASLFLAAALGQVCLHLEVTDECPRLFDVLVWRTRAAGFLPKMLQLGALVLLATGVVTLWKVAPPF